MPPPTLVEEAAAALKARGLRLAVAPGEYIVDWIKGGSAATEYRTDELADALAHGLAMGEAPQQQPPLGPMGRGNASARGRMYAHNRKLAKRRRKDKKE